MTSPQGLPDLTALTSGSKKSFLREHGPILKLFGTDLGREQIEPRVWGDVHTGSLGAASAPAASPDLDRELRALKTQVGELAREVGQLRTAVLAVGDTVGGVPRVSASWLTILETDSVELLKPIPIVIEESEDESTVSWPQAGVIGLGETLTESLVAFECELVETFVDLQGCDPVTLGPLPTRWLRAMANHLAAR